MTQTLVLYHDNCPDGFTAAWAVWRKLGDSAEYRAVNYGQPIPSDATDRAVIIVDFSYPRAQLDALADVAKRVSIYDHHKTAQSDLIGWTRGHVVFDMERSGAGIAWDEFTADKEALWLGARPRLVSYVEDRDLWRWALEDSREVSEYLFAAPRTFQEWDRLNAVWGYDTSSRLAEFGAAVECGRVLLRAKRLRVAEVCKNVRWGVFGREMYDFGRGVIIPIVNAAWDFSELGEYLCETFLDYACGGYYFDRVDRRQWGFRSRGDFDVSELCKLYGGGGHKNAAGFTSEIGWLPEIVAAPTGRRP